ncbi:MAG: putative dsRNA-binding protein, partial [Mariprofundales bacterium]|nr:putative dsRNA-binding protein [Mariprofundales bacterium]
QQGLGLPRYICTDLGVEKQPRFHALCMLGGDRLGMGYGGRKKDAEQSAARVALQRLIAQERGGVAEDG